MIVELPGLFSYLFYYIKVGFNGSTLYRHGFVMCTIQINVIERKENDCQNRMFIFACAYATMKQNVTLRLFFLHSRGRTLVYCLKPILNVRVQTVFHTQLLTFFDVMYLKVHKNGLAPKCQISDPIWTS